MEVAGRTPADAMTSHLQRFSNRVEHYAKHRPSYPAEAIDAVLAGLGAPERLVAADVGAGTGISSRLLSARGVRVHAVEPNGPMREEGTRSGDALISWHAGTAEATSLPDTSVDLVVCAQSFHWFDAPRALAEFRRILRSGAGACTGRVALVWNLAAAWDPMIRGYQTAIVKYATDPPTSPWFRSPTVELDARFGFTDCRMLVFHHAQEFDRESFVGRALSASYCPTSGPAHEALVAELRALFDRYAAGNLVRFPYVTEVFLASPI